MLTYSAEPFHALSIDDLAQWESLANAGWTFQSPFLNPAWSAAFARVSPRVEVVVVRDGGVAKGFFPFERDRWGIGRPVGGALCDLQGLVAEPALLIDLDMLLMSARLSAFEFHGLATKGLRITEDGSKLRSHFLDVEQGFEVYRGNRRRAGSQTVDKAIQRWRKLDRERGVRFALQAPVTPWILQLLNWKEQQLLRLGAVTPLQCPQTVAVLEDLVRAASPLGASLDNKKAGIRGIVSVLEAGDAAAGICYSLISGQTAHVLIVGYNPELARYSPGLVMLVELTRQLSAIGVRQIHLGAGNERFKTSLATGFLDLHSGVAGDSWPVVSYLRSWRNLRRVIKATPLSAVVRGLRPIRSWLAQTTPASPSHGRQFD